MRAVIVPGTSRLRKLGGGAMEGGDLVAAEHGAQAAGAQ